MYQAYDIFDFLFAFFDLVGRGQYYHEKENHHNSTHTRLSSTESLSLCTCCLCDLHSHNKLTLLLLTKLVAFPLPSLIQTKSRERCVVLVQVTETSISQQDTHAFLIRIPQVKHTSISTVICLAT